MKQVVLFAEAVYPPMVVWVKAPHFTAMLSFDRQSGLVIETAPILSWARGKSWGYVSGYFGRKGYDYVMWIDGHHPSEGGQLYYESAQHGSAKNPREQGDDGPDARDEHGGRGLRDGGARPDEPGHGVPAEHRR